MRGSTSPFQGEDGGSIPPTRSNSPPYFGRNDKIQTEMKKIWIKKFDSFAEADKAERQYYLKMGSTKRLETVQLLREWYLTFNKGKNEGRKGLRRVIKIVQQA